MGQRHQFFVIARVGKHYRCLAVVHRQSHHRQGVLSGCLQLINIFSDKSNRRALDMELALAVDFYKDQGPPTKIALSYEAYQPGAGVVRFPFISTCLVLGASTNREQPYVNLVHLEPEDQGFDQGDNNNGITVIDITDIDNLRYCFACWHQRSWYSDDGESDEQTAHLPPLRKPWSGWEYLRYFGSPSDPPNRFETVLADRLDKTSVIQVPALAGQ
jgi:hypothetical protein